MDKDDVSSLYVVVIVGVVAIVGICVFSFGGFNRSDVYFGQAAKIAPVANNVPPEDIPSVDNVGLPATRSSVFYVSSSFGNDSWSGHLTAPNVARTDGPWKTLQKVNSMIFSPGDNILFRRGDIWKDHVGIVISNNGTSSSPIVYGAYGSGNKPVLSLVSDVPGWRNSSNWQLVNARQGVWKLDLPDSILGIYGLWLDGRWYKMAQLVNPGLNFPFNPDNLIYTDINTYPYVDSEYRFKFNEFAHNGTIMELYVYAPTNPAQYYNTMEMNMADGAWYYDKYQAAVSAESKKYVEIKDLEFQAGLHQFYLYGANYFRIHDNSLRYITGTGIYLGNKGNTNYLSNNNEIYNNLIESDFDQLVGGTYDYYSTGSEPSTFLTVHFGISLMNGANYNKVYNNTFRDFYDAGIGIMNARGYPGGPTNHNEVYSNDFLLDNAKMSRAFNVALGDSYPYFLAYNRIYNNYIRNQGSDSHIGGDENYFYFNVWENVKHVIPSLYPEAGVAAAACCGSHKIYFFNNVIYNAAGYGLNLYNGPNESEFMNNIFINVDTQENGSNAIRDVWWWDFETNVTYRNNLFYYEDRTADDSMVKYQSRDIGIVAFNKAAAQGDIIDGNMQYVGSAESLISLSDFHLPLRSPAINAGADISNLVKSDFKDRNGNIINTHNPDLGAFGHIGLQ